MKIGILTNEYPPYVYGGAGVSVEYLTDELCRLDQGRHSVKVLCFGDQKEQGNNLSVSGVNPALEFRTVDPRHRKFLETMLNDLVMAGELSDVDIVHCHTWYSHLAGMLVRQLLQIPMVLTTHSLEPHRPWKVEQLGTAYHASSWVERTAYQNADGVVAVSQAMKEDVHKLYEVPLERIGIIHNGISLDQYKPTCDPQVLDQYGIDREIPYLLFVGRITRQKGIIHLVNAIRFIDPGVQIVLCAGAPDTKEIGEEMEQAVNEARRQTANSIVWIPEMLTKEAIVALYSQAAVFVCPSVYEPFGIINLEAMACETPVVASKVGGIPEVVIPDQTGLLVAIDQRGETDVEPANPQRFSEDLAAAVNRLLRAPEEGREMGKQARKRVEAHFSWASIAAKTLGFYQQTLKSRGSKT
ncbi:glycogen synthase [Candidatus Thiosymbion oneisti]|uniref:glycogen synthase n=1 Tax=Candidatus Thiosymbion oneisti TaxID=589554 RepID=UPI000B3303DA|nr:glycogen synthase [Candidatus Thiosymbion oneisti]